MRLTASAITWQVGTVILIFFVIALGMIGRGDYEDELLEQRIYCENVRTGVWPPYKGEEVQCD
jgi:hypothetical protein